MVLDGKVALVTGAGQGVGQGIALALAAEGARVAVTGRTASKLHATCKMIEERGGEALAVVCDVKSADSLAHCCFFSASYSVCPRWLARIPPTPPPMNSPGRRRW